MVEPGQEELAAAFCWEAADRVPGSAMTAFRRRARLHQARWREAHGHPIGSQPIVPKPGKPARPVGSRLPLDLARATGATFVTPAARAAAEHRSAHPEPHQTVDHQRLWADLLWSTALALNLFGDLAADPDLATRAARTWWPDTPGEATEVRFLHSPGRWDPGYLANLVAFDAALVLDLGDGTRGLVAVDVRYHEACQAETPRPDNLARYVEVAERSGVFAPGAIDRLRERSVLTVTWLEHLLALAMLQHPSGTWGCARYVVVHPAGNVDAAEAVTRYRGLLADPTTFSAITLEDLLDAGAGVLPAPTVAALRERYLVTS